MTAKPPIPADMVLQDRLHDYCTRNEITEADEDFFSELLREQAAEIERLRARVSELRESLREMATLWHDLHHQQRHSRSDSTFGRCNTEKCKRARALTEEK